MIVTDPAKKLTALELEELPDSDLYELVDGMLLERKMSTLSSFVAGKVYFHLQLYRDVHGGWVLPENTGYQCFPDDREKVRKADVAYILSARLSGAQVRAKGYLSIAPDLVVEVTSPNDYAWEVEGKVEDWLTAGVREVWVVDPSHKSMQRRRPDGACIVLKAQDEVTGLDVLPRFRCKLAEFFSNQDVAASGEI